MQTMAVFDNLEKAERTVDKLRLAGVPQSQIGIVGHVNDQLVPVSLGKMTPEEKATDNVVKGGILGAVIGLVVAGVVPILSGVIGYSPGFEILGGALLGAAVGGFILAFSSFAMNRRNAGFVANQLTSGRVIVTVTTPDGNEQVNALLRSETGPTNTM